MLDFETNEKRGYINGDRAGHHFFVRTRSSSFWGLGPSRNGACHSAAFLAGLPSMEQEIDCKLQSNSR